MDALGQEPISKQASAFLDRFMWDFQSDFEQILDLGEAFGKASAGEALVPEATFTTLAATRGCTWSLAEARQHIGGGCSGGASFIELLLAVSNKTCDEFFSPAEDIPPDVQRQLKAAVADYVQVQEETRKREERVASLKEIVKRGGVKGFAAKSELAQLEAAGQLAENRRRITGAAAKRMSNKIREQYQEKRREAGHKMQQAIDARLGALQAEEEERQAQKFGAFDSMFAAGNQQEDFSEEDDEDEESFDESAYPEITAELGEEEYAAEVGEEYTSSPAPDAAAVEAQAAEADEAAAKETQEAAEAEAEAEAAKEAAEAAEKEETERQQAEEDAAVAVAEAAREASEAEAEAARVEEEAEARLKEEAEAEAEAARVEEEAEARLKEEAEAEAEAARVEEEAEAEAARLEEEAEAARVEEEAEARLEEEAEAEAARVEEAEAEAARLEEAAEAARLEEEAEAEAARVEEEAEAEAARLAAEEEEARRLAEEEEARRLAEEEEEERREQEEYLRDLEVAKGLQREAEQQEQKEYEEELKQLEDAEAAEALALAVAQEQILEEEARLAQLELEREESDLQAREAQLSSASQVTKDLEALQQKEAQLLAEEEKRRAEEQEKQRLAQEQQEKQRLAAEKRLQEEEAERARAAKEEAAAAEEARLIQEAAALAAEKSASVAVAVEVDAGALMNADDLKPWKSRSGPLPSGDDLDAMESAIICKVHHPKTWSSVFKSTLKKGDKEKIASLRRIISRGTLNSAQQSRYIVRSGEDSVPIQLNEANMTVALTGLTAFNEAPLVEKPSIKGTAHFLKGDCIDVALWLRGSKSVNPVIVASCDPSGTTRGDYPDGSPSQEDELCRRTALRLILSKAGHTVPEQGALYVPEVPLIRDGPASGYSYVSHPNKISMICVSAVVAAGAPLTAPQQARIRSTVRTAFSVALQRGHDAIVVTALGCGFGGCSPKQVAPIFAEVVKQEFAKSFKHITFAILDDEVTGAKNFSQFQKAYVSASKKSRKKK